MPAAERDAAHYIVGIDLGTTNTVVAYADLRAPRAAGARPSIAVFDVMQLVAPGEVEKRDQLPSFRYHPAAGELSDADLALSPAQAAAGLPAGVVGTLAQSLGARVPGRLIASAKSWLCHAGVDRHAAILPWGAPDDVPKVSPVWASASYLMHVREAWDLAHPDAKLADQDVVLTVPASFDEGARALTLDAAQRAGLARVRLLEEPQAAFYAFLDRHRETLEADLAGVKLALVLDAGGGTTDLTLIHVELRESGPRLTRIAVGEHLLLGGDNMDHALARLCEPALAGGQEGARLPAARFSQLLQQCRLAKERLLAAGADDKVTVTLLGGGSKVVAGKQSTELTRAQVESALVDGFFARVPLDARPEQRRTGLVEFGLPFAADPVITRHVAAFLQRNRPQAAEALKMTIDDAANTPSAVLPDCVLFNGGVFNSQLLRERALEVLAGFRGAPLRLLDNPEPELAVARGAVAYGLARRGIGLRIGGGSPRSYYLGLDEAGAAGAGRGVCVLPRGSEEGEEHALRERKFALRIGKPVRFRLLASTGEHTHRPGEIVELDERYRPLPDIAAVIEGKPGDPAELSVELHAQLTEVGTLEMSLVASGDPQRRYRLEFQLRGDGGLARESITPARVTSAHPRLPEAIDLLQAFYGKAQKELPGRKINTLRSDLEKILGDRDRWETPLLRELFGQLLASAKRRRRSADHERIWFNLAGFGLRPGFGYPVDPWRIEQLWPLYGEGVQFAPDASVWSQFWIMWRRVAGGLDDAQQARIFEDLAYYLEPTTRPRPRKGPRAQGLEDMARLAGSLERLPAARKADLANWLIARLHKKELSAATVYWCLGRIGARAPWYGSAHTVVPPELVARWLEPLLAMDLKKTEQAAFAVTQLARFTHDRARDVPEGLRMRAATALEKVPGGEAWVKLVREGGELTAADAGRILGDSLPSGLRLL